MKSRNRYALSIAIIAAASLACSEPASPPTSPAASDGAITQAGPDGSTLRVTAPSAIFPVAGVELDDDDPDLVIANASATFVQDASLMYVFEVFDEGRLVYQSEPILAGDDGRTSHETAVVIAPDEEYTWRAYAVYDGHRGPMSSPASFRTANRFGVSCKGSELEIVAPRKAQYGSSRTVSCTCFWRKSPTTSTEPGMSIARTAAS
jgi:hypothetical protein